MKYFKKKGCSCFSRIITFCPFHYIFIKKIGLPPPCTIEAFYLAEIVDIGTGYHMLLQTIHWVSYTGVVAAAIVPPTKNQLFGILSWCDVKNLWRNLAKTFQIGSHHIKPLSLSIWGPLVELKSKQYAVAISTRGPGKLKEGAQQQCKRSRPRHQKSEAKQRTRE